MPKKSSISVAVIVLWLASLACGQSVTVPTVDPNAAGTAIAQTIVALQGTATPTPSPAAVSSSTPEVSPTDTPVRCDHPAVHRYPGPTDGLGLRGYVLPAGSGQGI